MHCKSKKDKMPINKAVYVIVEGGQGPEDTDRIVKKDLRQWQTDLEIKAEEVWSGSRRCSDTLYSKQRDRNVRFQNTSKAPPRRKALLGLNLTKQWLQTN